LTRVVCFRERLMIQFLPVKIRIGSLQTKPRARYTITKSINALTPAPSPKASAIHLFFHSSLRINSSRRQVKRLSSRPVVSHSFFPFSRQCTGKLEAKPVIPLETALPIAETLGIPKAIVDFRFAGDTRRGNSYESDFGSEFPSCDSGTKQ
jgi:hypothetical protein